MRPSSLNSPSDRLGILSDSRSEGGDALNPREERSVGQYHGGWSRHSGSLGFRGGAKNWQSLPTQVDTSLPPASVFRSQWRTTEDTTTTQSLTEIQADNIASSSNQQVQADIPGEVSFSSEKPAKPAEAKHSPLANMPLISPIESVPKNDIVGYYGTKLAKPNRIRQLQGASLVGGVIENCWYTWDDGGLPHVRRFTSIFTCPVSGERFASGRYGDAKYYKLVVTSGTETIWYTKKKLAEHAAARRALDCFSLRENSSNPILARRVCIEEPYLLPQEAPPFPQTPIPKHELWSPTVKFFRLWPPEANLGTNATDSTGDLDVEDENVSRTEYKQLRTSTGLEMGSKQWGNSTPSVATEKASSANTISDISSAMDES